MMQSLSHSSDHARLLERLAGLRPDTRRQWGRMSAHGMVCHLTDSFQIVLGTRPTSRTGTRLERTVLRLIALSLPVTWPKGVPTVQEVDQEQGGTPPQDFAADLDCLRAAMHDFVERVPAGAMTHPMFGRVSAAEWGRWGYRHVDHHLRQFGL